MRKLLLALAFALGTASGIYADCVARLEVIFTDPQMVHELCYERGKVADDGSLIIPGKQVILGCTDGRTVILPNNLDANVTAHELNHVLEINCPDQAFLKRLMEYYKARKAEEMKKNAKKGI